MMWEFREILHQIESSITFGINKLYLDVNIYIYIQRSNMGVNRDIRTMGKSDRSSEEGLFASPGRTQFWPYPGREECQSL